MGESRDQGKRRAEYQHHYEEESGRISGDAPGDEKQRANTEKEFCCVETADVYALPWFFEKEEHD